MPKPKKHTYSLTLHWGHYEDWTLRFEAESDKDAFLKLFGDPEDLPDEACDDPSYWFGQDAMAELYYHGDPPDDITLDRVKPVKGANKHMESVIKEVNRRRKVWEEEENREENEKEFRRLAKVLGKDIGE